MAAGLPVVAVDAGGPKEIVVHGETGLLAPSGAAVDLAVHIGTLVDDPELRRGLGVAGRQRYVSRFTEERMGGEMTDRLLEYASS
jgi:glycosyltransferase involved in cell wall biosynthesis